MGSLTEEELIQMVRDFLESESPESAAATASDSLSRNSKPRRLALQELLYEVSDNEIEVLEKILVYSRSVEAGVEANDLKKLVVMNLKMDGFEASLCKTSWVSSFNRPKVFHFTGDYEYIDVMMKDKNGGKSTRLIVDVDFRSQFELAKPTAAYKELTDILPCVFVGTEAKLSEIISLLCSAAKQSLKEKGFYVPPWRKAAYMQSKWLSKDCKKISIASNFETCS